jgi:hypothetical protein
MFTCMTVVAEDERPSCTILAWADGVRLHVSVRVAACADVWIHTLAEKLNTAAR